MASLMKKILLVMTLLTLEHNAINASILTVRPLNAREVYRLLKQSGHSDAIPEGRVITQGLAAISGFALGLTKGLGTALIYDIITANVTDLDLTDGNTNSNNGVGTRILTQEVCFNSRNARSLEEAEAIAEAYSRDDNKSEEEKRKVRSSEVERRITRNRRNKRKSQRRRKPGRLVLTKGALATATGTQTGTETNTETTNPTTTATLTDDESPGITSTAEAAPLVSATGGGTNVDNGEGTGTTSTSTTSTGRNSAINCVVIEKPAAK